eukprot:4926400-Alexandrium_andersonii.AAC.1
MCIRDSPLDAVLLEVETFQRKLKSTNNHTAPEGGEGREASGWQGKALVVWAIPISASALHSPTKLANI